MKFLIFPSLLMLASCYVPNKLYNKVPISIVSIEPTDTTVKGKAQTRTDRVDPKCDPSKHACLAFLEFDEMGEAWDPGPILKPGSSPPAEGICPEVDSTGKAPPGQLCAAIQLIRRAKSSSSHPVIMTFIHGWKNNANRDPKSPNGNVVGLEGVLEYLAEARENGQRIFGDSPVVGIYISWRGDLISKYFPASRALSYFNREGAAIRVPGASLTAALTEVMIETHRGKPGSLAIMVGHSFGGLVLERSLTQAMTDYVLRRRAESVTEGAARIARAGLSTMDLTPELRSAYHLPDDLKGALVGSARPGTGVEAGDVITSLEGEPIISAAELTRIFSTATPGSLLNAELLRNGTHAQARLGIGVDGVWADLVIYLNSAAAASEGKQMMDLLKDLDYGIPAQSAGRDSRQRSRQRPLVLSISSLGDVATRFAVPAGHSPSFLSRQITGSWRTYDDPQPKEVKSQSAYYLSTTAHLEAIQSHIIVENPKTPCAAPYSPPFTLSNKKTYQICEKPDRWNDTPYWAMQMPVSIVPDHTGIFNENFIGLLRQFLPSPEEMSQVVARPRLMRKSKVK